MAVEIARSRSNLYKKVKAVSGQTVAGFIRYVRLEKAAELLINTENNINETASAVGFYDLKYFRKNSQSFSASILPFTGENLESSFIIITWEENLKNYFFVIKR